MRAHLYLIGAIAGCSGFDPYEQPPVAPPQPTAIDCENVLFDGATYNCDQLDVCDFSQASIPARVACCDCDPGLCDPPGAGVCPDPLVDPPIPPDEPAEGCMECHNGSQYDDYAGDGMSNPHWVNGPAQYLRCTQCHGGDGEASGATEAHVPRPPSIGTDAAMTVNAEAYFNYLTLTGIDKLPDYTVSGKTYTAIDFLQFLNPGDLRVVSGNRSCGTAGCHSGEHASWVPLSPIATETGFYSNTMYTAGAPQALGLDYYTNTASDYAFRAVGDPTWVYSSDPATIGQVGQLLEFPERAVYGDVLGFYNNPAYDANTIANFRYNANQADTYVNQVIPGSPLQHVVEQGVSFFCGDCHLGSKGANNRYGDFRSSGCTSCHMVYTLDGTSKSTDPNVEKDEPADPDAIAAPERSHVESHQLRNVVKTVQTFFGPVLVGGIQDKACVGCHQGSNRTVLQYWGVRLDQNADLVNGQQYPTNPFTFVTTAGDQRFFDPAVGNQTFNGRNANQYILDEDYDGDARDDTPPDIHYEKGLGCIDCHGSRDVHNGTRSEDGQGGWIDDPNNGRLWSKMDQSVGIGCESCHGDETGYGPTTSCVDYDGNTAVCVADRFGNPVRNVTVNGLGDRMLMSRLDARPHFVPQTFDTIVDTQRINPLTGARLYSPNASYAMGVADGNPSNGTGPMQTDPDIYSYGFTHMENLACDACHASWSNNCIGCHIQVAYNDNPANYFFSNTTGERITVQGTNADFTYINPFWSFLQVTPRGEIGSGQPGMKAFWRFLDQNNNLAAGITFSDRNGNGSNANFGTSATPALSHNRIYAHSTRGKVDAYNEGPKQCNACHLNVAMIDDFGAEYAAFYQDNVDQNYNNLDFALLQQHIGQNTNNHLNSPFYVHMVAGLGTGLLLFDANGCPVNPLDANANRQFCQNVSPADQFDINNAAYNLDRTVEITGAANASFTKPLIDYRGVPLRAGSQEPTLSGPMGFELLNKLADPNTTLLLDSWLDSDGNAQGDAANFIF